MTHKYLHFINIGCIVNMTKTNLMTNTKYNLIFNINQSLQLHMIKYSDIIALSHCKFK